MGVMTVYDFLFGVKRVDESCFDLFAPFYQQRARQYVYPVFYQSVTQMIAANGFFYKVFQRQGRKTLAIFKRSSIMGNYSVMLHIAPISLTGNRQDELEIMQTARNVGLSLKVSGEDIQRYRIPRTLCQPIYGNSEYLYNANECYAAQGGKFKGFRRQRTRITKMAGYQHRLGASDDIEALVAAWDTHNHEKRSGRERTSCLPDWRNIKRLHHMNLYVHRIYVGETLECFSVIERLADNHWVFVMGMRNPTSELNDVNVCMHWLDCEIAHNDKKIAVYGNLGASLGMAGLSAAKEKLKPCAKQQIFKVAPTRKLDEQKIKSLFV